MKERRKFSKPSSANDFEKRKLAEQRATKRLKGENIQNGKIGCLSTFLMKKSLMKK